MKNNFMSFLRTLKWNYECITEIIWILFSFSIIIKGIVLVYVTQGGRFQ